MFLKQGNLEGEILAETPMDTHQVCLPPIEIASQRVEAGVSKEAVATKEERQSKAASSINPVDTPSSTPPPVESATVPDEMVVKQKWIDLCEQWRLPVKQKYRLQFKETMQFKTEVKRLRRQVHRLKKQVKKYKRRAKKPKATMAEAETQVDELETTSVATKIDPIEYLFEGPEFSLTAEVQTWKSTVVRYQNEVKRAQERASTAIFEYVEHIDIMRLTYAQQQLKVEQLERQVAELKADKEQILNLAQEVMSCRPPASSYSLFLHERFLFSCLESIKKEISHEIEDGVQFLQILRAHGVPTQRLMCELYMHEYLLRVDREFNLVPYVGDIHLSTLTSYTFNQISWQKAYNTFESNKVMKPFMVR